MVQTDCGFGGTENVVLKNVLEIENLYKPKKAPLLVLTQIDPSSENSR